MNVDETIVMNHQKRLELKYHRRFIHINGNNITPKRYNLLNDIINYTFSGVFSFFIRIFVPERV